MPCSEFDCDNDSTSHTRSINLFPKDLAGRGGLDRAPRSPQANFEAVSRRSMWAAKRRPQPHVGMFEAGAGWPSLLQVI